MFRLFDILLYPIMWILGGLNYPVQETHNWHVKGWKWNKKGLIISKHDDAAKFGHDSHLGLFHIPIFGGLTKYVVIEAQGFDKYWHVGFGSQIHLLPIFENRIKILVGKNGFVAHGLSDSNKDIKLKIVGFGIIGDSKYNGLRLF